MNKHGHGDCTMRLGSEPQDQEAQGVCKEAVW